MDKISSVLDAEIDIADRPSARPIGRIDGRLELDRVTFSYGEDPVLHAIEISVPPGGCIAIVGESGGGKSTTAKLIARFYDPTRAPCASTARTCATSSSSATAASSASCSRTRSSSAARSRTTSASAKPDASDEEVRATAAAVGVDRVAAPARDGLEHIVREGGAGLSAGERQLISIRREPGAALAHGVVEALREAPRDTVDADRRGRRAHLVVGGLGAPEADVGGDRPGEQEGVLQHHAELAAVADELDVAHVMPSTRTVPACGSWKRATSFASVDLPPPDSPTRARQPPAGTWMSIAPPRAPRRTRT